jgi:hypothetical protein
MRFQLKQAPVVFSTFWALASLILVSLLPVWTTQSSAPSPTSPPPPGTLFDCILSFDEDLRKPGGADLRTYGWDLAKLVGALLGGALLGRLIYPRWERYQLRESWRAERESAKDGGNPAQ